MSNVQTKQANKTPVPYFSMNFDKENNEADIFIFGDIVSWPWEELGEESGTSIVNKIKALPNDAALRIHINSYGGELKEGLGIYNVLKARENVTTICDGFAASAASIVFCAGKTRIMQPASLLFIHNAAMLAYGDANALEKGAEDLRTMTDSAIAAYRECGVNVEVEDLKTMMDTETWITPEDAISMGFATQISDEEDDGTVKNDAMKCIMKAVKNSKQPIGNIEIGIDPSAEFKEVLNTLRTFNEKMDTFLEKTTDSTPTPAQVEHKGFFGFGGTVTN